MDKQLMNDLNTLKAAVAKQREMLDKRNYNTREFMDEKIIKRYEDAQKMPDKPTKPREPALRLSEEINVEAQVQRYAVHGGVDKKDYLAPKFVTAIGVGIIIVGLIILFVGNSMLKGAQERINNIDYNTYWPSQADRARELAYWENRANTGEVLKIISFITMGAGVASYFVVWLIRAIIASGKKAKNIKEHRKHLIDLKASNEHSNEKAKEEHEKAMAKYKEKKLQYEKDCATYKVALDEKEMSEKLYNEQYQIADKKRIEFNEAIEKKAQDYLDGVLSSLGTYYPKKYISALNRVAGYVEDARAETLQEAINLYEQETREEAFRNQQLYAAEEAARSAEEAVNRTYSYVVRYRRWENGRQYASSTIVQARDAADAKAQVEGAYEAEKRDW